MTSTVLLSSLITVPGHTIVAIEIAEIFGTFSDRMHRLFASVATDNRLRLMGVTVGIGTTALLAARHNLSTMTVIVTVFLTFITSVRNTSWVRIEITDLLHKCTLVAHEAPHERRSSQLHT